MNRGTGITEPNVGQVTLGIERTDATLNHHDERIRGLLEVGIFLRARGIFPLVVDVGYAYLPNDRVIGPIDAPIAAAAADVLYLEGLLS
jgi:hypothetical protein